MEISKEAFVNGQVILIDKPLEWSSFQVVNKVRWLIRKHFNIKKLKWAMQGHSTPSPPDYSFCVVGK